ncbi:MAG TPA: tyrosine-type recombinase/integrase, partial [Kiritimatiellia bacterium]|nr:tyrosine-type recombinase/integrase [Kiritimatiellia bacterium]
MKIDLQTKMTSYLSLREALGLSTAYLIPLLHEFVEYLRTKHDGENIRAQHAIEWVCSTESSVSTRKVRLTAARLFLRHLKDGLPGTEIPSFLAIERSRRPEPFIFSAKQLSRLLKIAGKLDEGRNMEALTVQTLLGLMACTGLRPGEAIKLKTPNVFLDDMPPRLLIYRSKFCKTRWVPLHATTCRKLSKYMQFRQKQSRSGYSNYLFVKKDGRKLHYLTLQRTFQEFIKKAEIEPRGGQMRPTLHSLRHTFAVHRLLRWYE